MRPLAAAPLLCLLAACATARPPAWLPADAPYTSRDGFTATAPPGWMRANLDPKGEGKGEKTGRLVLTRDGAALNRIVGAAVEAGKPIGFGKSTRVVAVGMSISELGELALDDIRSEEGITDVQVLETAPARLDGREGFHLLLTFRDEGLPRRLSLYGALDGQRFYALFYVAPARVYFDRDLAAFGEVVRSFRISARTGQAAADRS
jgi:hypothetical protein